MADKAISTYKSKFMKKNKFNLEDIIAQDLTEEQKQLQAQKNNTFSKTTADSSNDFNKSEASSFNDFNRAKSDLHNIPDNIASLDLFKTTMYTKSDDEIKQFIASFDAVEPIKKADFNLETIDLILAEREADFNSEKLRHAKDNLSKLLKKNNLTTKTTAKTKSSETEVKPRRTSKAAAKSASVESSSETKTKRTSKTSASKSASAKSSSEAKTKQTSKTSASKSASAKSSSEAKTKRTSKTSASKSASAKSSSEAKTKRTSKASSAK